MAERTSASCGMERNNGVEKRTEVEYHTSYWADLEPLVYFFKGILSLNFPADQKSPALGTVLNVVGAARDLFHKISEFIAVGSLASIFTRPLFQPMSDTLPHIP